jgi:glycosyltransferase involved in cell wall biosynthesis
MFSPVEREEAKKQFGFPHKVVAFVGNIVEIKNVLLLPSIFQNVQRKYSDKSISFWVIGDGELRDPLIKMLNKAVGHFKFWGDQPPSMMPTFMNCIDVLVLPSKNEGLPLVTLEALSCGANVVGARVGGIAECVGVDNTFEHDAHFVENISDRIVEMLNNKIIQRIPPKMNWQSSAQTENDIYRHFLYNGEGSSMPI